MMNEIQVIDTFRKLERKATKLGLTLKPTRNSISRIEIWRDGIDINTWLCALNDLEAYLDGYSDAFGQFATKSS